MRLQKYLVVSKAHSRYGYASPKVELKEREPKVQGNEVAIFLDIEIPEAFFTRPTLIAQMTIPSEAVPKNSITTNVTNNLARIIKDATGLTMSVSVVEQDKKPPYDKPDTIDRQNGDFSNLQKFRIGQKVRFYCTKESGVDWAGVHTVKAVQKAEIGQIIQTDRCGESWIHVHWFAPVR